MLYKSKSDNSPWGRKLYKLHWLRHLSRAVMAFGFLASAGGNVLHAQKSPVGITLAMLPPTILFLAFEMVSRVPIRKEARWHTKVLRLSATSAIATIMALLSYFHQRDAIFAATDGDQLAAYLLPGSVDALMIVGSVTLIELAIQIEDLEARIEGNAVRVSKPAQVAPKAETTSAKKANIAQLWRRYPDLSIKELAVKAGTSYEYARSIIAELKKEPAPEPVEAVA